MDDGDLQGRRRRLGEILIDHGVLTPEQLEEALEEQRTFRPRQRLGTAVVRLGLCSEDDVVEALARQLGFLVVDPDVTHPEPEALSRVPRRIAERHRALPLRLESDGHLVVAMSDPTNVVALDDLRLTSGASGIRPVVAAETALDDALTRAYGSDTTAQRMVDALHEDEVETIDEASLDDLADVTEGVDEAPVKRLASAILADAVRARASDVHVEPTREAVRVRYRIDGLLRENMHVPRTIARSLTSRLKIMSGLDIAERRRPQDGRAMIRVDDQEVDVRVSTMPTMFGETVVLRLLRKGAERLGLDELGMSPQDHQLFSRALDQPQGLVLCTGPTGSGKTTTLYAGLSSIVDPTRNVLTLEDPIEYQLAGVNQTQINPKIGLTFARGLRTVLRQDPDVVMVGEIRDQETAALAMDASFTGHLVLSTLHTNNAPSTIVRLLDLGVERFLIASSLLQIVAQRLVRTVCQGCAEPTSPDQRTLHLLRLGEQDVAAADLVRGAGCRECEGSGFLGRTGVYEVLAVTPQLREAILAGASEKAIAHIGRSQGMRTLRDDGIDKALRGETTLEEVLRVTPDEATSVRRCPACGAMVGDDFVMCPLCEHRLEADDCAGCGRPLDRAWTVCPHCGTRTGLGRQPTPVTPVGADEADDSADERPPPTILVVEDDESVLRFITTVLSDAYRVIEATDGEAVLTLIEQERPDAIVLDLRLPDVDGLEVTRRVRALDEGFRVPIVMVTGATEPATEVESVLAGVDEFVVKPFDEEVLLASVASALRRRPGADSPDARAR